MATPMVPGEGLALRACLFADYNRRFGDELIGGYPSIDFEKNEVRERTHEFRLGVLYPVMVNQEREANVFARYIYMQEANKFPSTALKKALEYSDYRDKDRERQAANWLSKRRPPAQENNNNNVKKARHDVDDEVTAFLSAHSNNVS